MIRLRLSSDDLGRIRFASSPLWETVLSLRALTRADGRRRHDPWVRQVAPRLRDADVDLALLTAVVRPDGYIPDFLVPSPSSSRSTIAAGLEQVAAADRNGVAWQLDHLAEHRIGQAGPGTTARVRLLRDLAAEPDVAVARITEHVARYFELAIAPSWDRISALLAADRAYRLEQLSEGGIEALFRSLHPHVKLEGQDVCVVKYYDGTADLDGRGLLLVPSVFAWPDVVVLTAEPHTPTLTYSPRAIARLWSDVVPDERHPLVDVLGRTRTSLLAHLDLPMSTTQLADQLVLSAPTLNAHLKALAGAGLVTARRDGRSVLYGRSELGERLLDPHPDGD